MKKTHKVIDLVYQEDEGNEVFDGTLEECLQFVAEQSKGSEMAAFTYQVVPMTKEEIESHPDNQNE